MQHSEPTDGQIHKGQRTQPEQDRHTGDIISIKTRDRDNVEVIEAELWGLRREVGRVFLREIPEVAENPR